jgi:hypothetical protein
VSLPPVAPLGSHLTDELDPDHHIFRYVGGSLIDGDEVDSSAFWRKEKDGQLEVGVSVNWVEWFGVPTPEEAVQPLRQVFEKKNFKTGATSRFALLNVGQAQTSAAQYAVVSIARNPEPDDESHSLIGDYDAALNEQVAEQLKKVIIATYPTKRA